MTSSSARTHDRHADTGLDVGDPVRLDGDEELFEDRPEHTTAIGQIAIDLGEPEGPFTQSRAEAIVELIVKSDRVFLDGACWRCTERLPVSGHDLGLCEQCLVELKS
jgi:hypothetical protein